MAVAHMYTSIDGAKQYRSADGPLTAARVRLHNAANWLRSHNFHRGALAGLAVGLVAAFMVRPTPFPYHSAAHSTYVDSFCTLTYLYPREHCLRHSLVQARRIYDVLQIFPEISLHSRASIECPRRALALSVSDRSLGARCGRTNSRTNHVLGLWTSQARGGEIGAAA